MDSTTILDAFFWIMGVLSGGFLAYGGWLCLLHRSGEARKPRASKVRARQRWPRAARFS
jgi:threonine/homoserine/homoserine lactone efflux protein